MWFSKCGPRLAALAAPGSWWDMQALAPAQIWIRNSGEELRLFQQASRWCCWAPMSESLCPGTSAPLSSVTTSASSSHTQLLTLYIFLNKTKQSEVTVQTPTTLPLLPASVLVSSVFLHVFENEFPMLLSFYFGSRSIQGHLSIHFPPSSYIIFSTSIISITFPSAHTCYFLL